MVVPEDPSDRQKRSLRFINRKGTSFAGLQIYRFFGLVVWQTETLKNQEHADCGSD